ncbi:methyltransferase-like protein 25B isoform X2 [Ostrea edulis]|nr:methyltransferase-like protein 25B isoform X2 [Ostrea edulis]
MNPKKQHEVRHMAALISDIAIKTGCDVVIDVGSGLGYLGHVLNTVYGLKVIGLESKQSHTSGADKRTFSDSNRDIINVTFEMEDSPDSVSEFKTLISSCLKKFRKEEIDNENIQDHVNSTMKATTKSEVQPTSDVDCTSVEHLKNSKTYDYSIGECSPQYENMQSEENKTNVQDCRNDLCGSCVKSRTESDRSDEASKAATESDQSDEANKAATESDQSDEASKAATKSDQRDEASKTATEGNLDQYSRQCILIGLHCCGDLTPAMLKVYSDVKFLRGLCCVSCCYHRMSKQGDGYSHFPMSKITENTMLKCRLRPTVPFLRLAAQETRARWRTQSEETHESHTKAVAYRSLLELFAHQENTECNKLFRRIATAGDFVNFQSYVDKTLSRCEFASLQGKESVKYKLISLYEEYKAKFPYIEVITVLQVILQPLIERLIIQDRVMWLLENGQKSYLIPLFDDVISPRNIALCSTKTH